MLDPFALPRPPKATTSLVLEHQGKSVQIELRQLDLLDTHRMLALRDRMIAKYVPLSERTQSVGGDPADFTPVDFPPVGGEPVQLNEETCEACATLAVMQGTFGFEALVALALTCPNLFEQLIAAAGKLNRGNHGGLFEGKAIAGGTKGSSGEPSNGDLATTQS